MNESLSLCLDNLYMKKYGVLNNGGLGLRLGKNVVKFEVLK